MTITNKFWVGGRKKRKMALALLDNRNETLLKRCGPQRQSHSNWNLLVTLLTQLLLTYLPSTCSLVNFMYLYLPLRTTWLDFRHPCTWYLTSSPCLFSLYGYQYSEFCPWASNLILNTTKPVGYPWYISLFLYQGLNQICLSYYLLKTAWCYSQMGVLYLSL